MLSDERLTEQTCRLCQRQRAISCAEMCVAILVVIAHNVYHWIPNEVPILLVLAIASFRIREGQWGAQLYRRPKSWPKTLVAALLCFGALLLKDVIMEPIGLHFWPEPQHLSSIASHSHDLRSMLMTVAFVWLFAGVGEEIGYRGYLLRRALDVFGTSRLGVAVALVVASMSFGFGHFYKGPAGILDSSGSGLVLGIAYLWSRRLWVGSLAHGLNDTVFVAIQYLGG